MTPRRLALFPALFGLFACGPAVLDPVSGSSDDDGLVAHWTFDETSGTVAHDSSRNGFDGVLSGGSWIAGRFNGALYLKSGERVTFANFQQATASWTVSLWVRFGHGDLAMGRSPLIGNATDAGGWELNAPDDSKPPLMEVTYWREGGNNNGSHVHVACCSPSDDTWMHLTVTVDGSNKNVTIKANNSASTTVAESLILPGDDSLSIGTASSSQFQGAVDEVRIYKRVLTANEIRAFDQTP